MRSKINHPENEWKYLIRDRNKLILEENKEENQENSPTSKK